MCSDSESERHFWELERHFLRERSDLPGSEFHPFFTATVTKIRAFTRHNEFEESFVKKFTIKKLISVSKSGAKCKYMGNSFRKFACGALFSFFFERPFLKLFIVGTTSLDVELSTPLLRTCCTSVTQKTASACPSLLNSLKRQLELRMSGSFVTDLQFELNGMEEPSKSPARHQHEPDKQQPQPYPISEFSFHNNHVYNLNRFPSNRSPKSKEKMYLKFYAEEKLFRN